LGAWVFLHDLRQRDGRRHQAVSGITFLQVMPPASAGGPSLRRMATGAAVSILRV